MDKKKLITIIICALSAVIAAVAAVLIILHFGKEVKDNIVNSSSSPLISDDLTSSLPAVVEDNGIRLVFSSPTARTINTTNSQITFTGTSDEQEVLTVNGTEIERSVDGIFSYTADLSVGKNTFEFCHKGETHTFTVNYRYVIISWYSPEKNQLYSSNSTFSVGVMARKGSVVTATFNGQTISLAVGEDNENTSEFIGYYGSFTLPVNNGYEDITLGKVVFKATHNGKFESFSSGNITCKKPDFIVDFDPNATPLGDRYINVGSGIIAEIVGYEAETFDAYSTDDASRPTNNYLPKGTVDYCAQGSVYSKDKKEYAVLRCGRQVYLKRKDTPRDSETIITTKRAGVLPETNQIGIASFENTGRHTVLTLDSAWKAPFYFDILPQAYENPSKQNYSVSNVTSRYIDITFCYSDNLSGELIIPEDNPIFSAFEIIKNTSDYTLRLFLKKQGGFYGWDCFYNDQNQLVFEFLNPAKITTAQNKYGVDLTGVVILIDVGHGGIDIGAEGFDYKNHNEAIQNLALTYKLANELKSTGATVYATRNDNSTSSTDDKIKILKNMKPDICIAIHHNSNDSPKPSGFDSRYFNSFSKNAAEYIYNHTYNTGIYQNHKLGWHYYFMARKTNCPIVLTENGFISNSFDYANIVSEQANNKKAEAITRGIAEYFLKIQ